MTIGQAVKSCFRQYAGFAGRAPRSEFWWWCLFAGLVHLLALLAVAVFEGSSEFADAGLQDSSSGSPAYAVFLALVYVPTLAVMVRRLHDTDWPAWWAIPPAVATAAVVYMAWVGPYEAGRLTGESPLFLFGYLAAALVSLVVWIRMFFRGTQGANRFGSDPLGSSVRGSVT